MVQSVPQGCWKMTTLVGALRRDGPTLHLADAFDARPREIESAWRDYLRKIARPSMD